MDLATIQLRVNNKMYKSRQEFVQDLELIVNNCLTYNGDDSCKLTFAFFVVVVDYSFLNNKLLLL